MPACAARLLLALALLAAAPAAVAADAWSDGDVEAAERYRDLERERADRYRAAREAPPEARPAPGREAQPPAAAPARESLGEGLGERLRAWLADSFTALLQALGEWLRDALYRVLGLDEERATTPRELAPAEPSGFEAWLRREEGRAHDWLEQRPLPEPPALERMQEWERRERARERARAQPAQGETVGSPD